MNTKKIVSISGTVLLTAFGVFIGHASSRFSGNIATNLFATDGAGHCVNSLIGGNVAGSWYLTTGGTGPAAYIKSSFGAHQLYNTGGCGVTHKIHFNI